MWSGDSSRVTQQVALNAFDENVGVDRNPYSTAVAEVTALWGRGSLSRPPTGPQGEAWGPPQRAGLGDAWPGDVGLLLLPSPSSAFVSWPLQLPIPSLLPPLPLSSFLLPLSLPPFPFLPTLSPFPLPLSPLFPSPLLLPYPLHGLSSTPQSQCLSCHQPAILSPLFSCLCHVLSLHAGNPGCPGRRLSCSLPRREPRKV